MYADTLSPAFSADIFSLPLAAPPFSIRFQPPRHYAADIIFIDAFRHHFRA
jgi:hypothetical protein